MRSRQDPERDSFGRSRPEPPAEGRLLVGWPHPIPLLAFAAVLAIGVFALALGGSGGIAVGVIFTLVGGGCLATIASTRVWVDGSVLLLRRPFRGTRTLRLDRITRASLSSFGSNKGPELTLADADGAELTIDATNLSLTGLYIVLAEHIPAGGAGGDKRLERRLHKHRSSELPG